MFFTIFLYRKISDELQKNFDDISNDVKNTFEGKNAGKILRLAGILSYLFQVVDRDSCIDDEFMHELEKSKEYGTEACNVDNSEINCMAMDAAIDLVNISHKQMMAILGFTDDSEIMGNLTDIGKAILSGGTCLSSIKLNVDRFAGRKTNRKLIHELFGQMEELNMGHILMKSRTPVFQIRHDIVENAKEDRQLRKMLYSHGVSLAALEDSLSREECVIKNTTSESVGVAAKKETHSTSQNVSIDNEMASSSITADATNENFFTFAEHIFQNNIDKTLHNSNATCSQKKNEPSCSKSSTKIGKNKLKRVLKDVSFKFKHSTPIRDNQSKNIPFDTSFNDFDCNATRIPCEKQKGKDNDETLHKKVRKNDSIPKDSFCDI